MFAALVRSAARSTGVGVVCAGVAAAGLTGCAGDPDQGTNGVGRLPAPAMVSQARAAAERAATVRLTGEVVSRGRTYRLDMRLAGDGGAGQVTTDRRSFQLLRIGRDLYLRAGADFYGHGGGVGAGGSGRPSAAAELRDKYVKVPVGDPAYRQLSGLTDKKVLLDGLFSLGAHPSRGGHRSVDGTRTIAVSAGTGTLDVSLQGTPYPLRYQPRSGRTGSLQLADWGQEFTLRAPRSGDVVDYGRQITGG